MVSTRQSTGKLPPPKLSKSDFADTDAESDDESAGEYEVEPSRSPNKRLKLEHTDLDYGEVCKPGLAYVVRSAASKKVPSRFDVVVTGEFSKANRIAQIQSTGNQEERKASKHKYVGKLALFMNMPVDLFCEVAGHLCPLDILQLARVSHQSREVLMSKRSRSIWRAARIKLDMPDCPSDLSEPQYVNLVFEKDCHGCGAPRVQNVNYPLRIRLCKGCYSYNIVRGTTMAKEAFGKTIMRDLVIYTLLPFHKANKVRNGVDLSRQYFFKPDFMTVVAKYVSLGSDPDARKKYVEERKQITKEMCEHSLAVMMWQREINDKKSQQSDEHLKRRRESVKAKLLELGHTEDDVRDQWDRFSGEWHSYVDQPRELTPRIWKNIGPKLEALIMKRRELAQQRLLEKKYQQRKSELGNFYDQYVSGLALPNDEKLLMPTITQLSHVPLVTELIERSNGEIVVTQEVWDTVLPSVLEHVERYKKDVIADCTSILTTARQSLKLKGKSEETSDSAQTDPQESQPSPDDDLVRLQLASSIFQCKQCYDPINFNCGFPAILGHSHVLGSDRLWAAYQRTWDATRVTCDSLTLKLADTLLLSLELPSSTTSEFMNNIGSNFICKRCDPAFKKKYTWDELLRHYKQEENWFNRAQNRATTSGLGIKVVDDHDTNDPSPLAAIDVEVDLAVDPAPATLAQHSCLLCRRIQNFQRRMTRDQVEAHIRGRHGKTPEPADFAEE